ncbi:hypothetical protein ACIGZJ_30635, partial [Kitasatospora sp. NPDC052868]|uniref:hypothetical protein n=1 Tax=Kitasatospora sp. NPDC052868 TaxID=3364060 RepID=UPI0037C7B8C2
RPAGRDIEAVITGATARETTVPLCLAGALQGEYEALERQLTDSASLVGESLAGSPRVQVASRMEELRAEMAGHLVSFRLRAMEPEAWSDLLAAHPGANGKLFDPATFGPAAVAACALDPAMTVEQYQRLEKRLSHGQREVLLDAVWNLNTAAAQSVPFSLLASATAAGRTGES